MAGVKCADPECQYEANADPSVSDGFCCEKCEGRFNGEEWALGGKKKHTAYCTSKDENSGGGSGGYDYGGGGWGVSYGAFGMGGNPRKCANPDCYYLKHSDPSYSRKYCCEKCEGVHKGEEWAEGGKNHYKHCERIEADSAEAQGFGGGDDGFGGFGCKGCGKWGGGGGMWVQLQELMGGGGGWEMEDDWGGGGGGWGSKGKGKGKGKGKAPGSFQQLVNPLAGKGKGKSKDKGASKGPSLRDFPAEAKLWVGNLPEDTTAELLQEHFGLAGGTVKFAALMKNGTGGVAFDNAEEAIQAMSILNMSDMGGQAIQVDVWTGK